MDRINAALRSDRSNADDGAGGVAHADLIVPLLYLGDIDAAAAVSKSNVRDVVNAAPRRVPSYHAGRRGWKYLEVAVRDLPTTQLLADGHIGRAVTFIDDAIRSGRPVLVHCYVGMSRSVTLVAAYLMARYGLSAREAVCYIRSRRGIACPNKGFIDQLGDLEREQTRKPKHRRSRS